MTTGPSTTNPPPESPQPPQQAQESQEDQENQGVRPQSPQPPTTPEPEPEPEPEPPQQPPAPASFTEEPPGPAGSAEHGSPPPLTAAAWRAGLVRPQTGRMVAGVCGAVGRATNTDPVLWRVVFAVLTVFSGVGIIAYIVGWLLLPAQSDTATPIEALFGRGHSSTSKALTAIGLMIVMISTGIFAAEPLFSGVLGVALVGGAVLLLMHDQRTRTGPGSPGSNPAATMAGGIPTQGGPTQGGVPTASAPPAFADQPPGAPPRPPFAPYGPYASGPPPMAAPPPRVARPKSQLGRVTVSVGLLAVGTLAMLDLAGLTFSQTLYLAIPLTIVAVGLLVGTWFGRARGLIGLGIILSLLLAATTAAEIRFGSAWRHVGPVEWSVDSVAELQDSYQHDIGELRIDLSKVDFTGHDVTVDASLDLGNLEIILPPDVDAAVTADVGIGNATVFDGSISGIGPDPRTVIDSGADGPGGGMLSIHARVDIGNIEVRR